VASKVLLELLGGIFNKRLKTLTNKITQTSKNATGIKNVKCFYIYGEYRLNFAE